MGRRTQKPARRHHLVSKFYLQHFANTDDQVTTVLLPGDKTFTQSIGDASVENDFYTAIGHDGGQTDAAERAFGQIEAPAAQAWRQIAEGVWPLPTQARGAVASWIALSLLRGAGSRTMLSNLGTDLLQLNISIGGREQLRRILRDNGDPYGDAAVNEQWVELFAEPVSVEVDANQHLSHLVDTLPRVAESIFERWWILTTFQRKALATSDHPVYVVPNASDIELGLGTGFETAELIHVPLTRRDSLGLALRTTIPPEMASRAVKDVQQDGVTSAARYSNDCAVRSARRALFHHPDDQPLQGIALHPPITREIGSDGDPWRFMSAEDRQVLLNAGLIPSRLGSLPAGDH